MDQAPAVDLSAVARALEAGGLDLVAPLPQPHGLAWLVGNTRALWPVFLAACHADDALRAAAHPLDTYVTGVISRAVDHSPAPTSVEWGHGDDPPALQRLAVEAGLGWSSPAHLVVHPTYGPWIGLRAVIHFHGLPPAPPPQPAPPCSGCASGCQRALARAMARSPLTAAGVKAHWPVWAAVRRACPIGHMHTYCESQTAYHYTHNRAILDP